MVKICCGCCWLSVGSCCVGFVICICVLVVCWYSVMCWWCFCRSMGIVLFL